MADKKTLKELDYRQIKALLHGLQLVQQQLEQQPQVVPGGEDDIPPRPSSRKPIKPGTPEWEKDWEWRLKAEEHRLKRKPTVEEIEKLYRLINAGELWWKGTDEEWIESH